MIELIHGDASGKMIEIKDAYIDLTVTSPPYDSIRNYNGNIDGWSFDKFKLIAKELYRVTRIGGIVVWIVSDQTINGSESGSSFKQALFFMELGFNLHDTMIYEKNSSSFPARKDGKRYTQIFEYMFVFTKGKIRSNIALLKDKKNKWAGHTNWGNNTQYNSNGELIATNNINPVPEFSLRNNIWKYSVGFNDKTGHPAVFPEKLAEDHILSWSNIGDIIFDPFMGSGTTGKMAALNRRNFIGIEIDDSYYKVAYERINKAEMKMVVD